MLASGRGALRVARNARNVSNQTSLVSPQGEKGILESLFSRSKMPVVPLDEPFPGLPALNEVAAVQHPTETTTLESGLKVVSVNSNSPVASVAAFVDAGSRYETYQNSGTSHFLEFFAFKSTTNRSDFKLVRDMLKIGANVLCTTSREHTVYAADAMEQHVPEVMDTLADVIINPAFLMDEMHDGNPQYLEGLKAHTSDPLVQIMEGIHAAAYHNNTLGQPLYAPEHAKFTKEGLQAHMKSLYTSDRMVISGAGIEHEKLVEIVKNSFTDLAGPSTTAVKEQAQYTGGDVLIPTPGGDVSHVALAFETADWNSADLVPMCVLQMIMGGGGSFSAGGPGKGMYSRLYQNLLNQHHWVESANSFNSIFSDSSIFGMYATSGAESSGHLVDVMCQELVHMADQVPDDELSRAKNQLKSSLQMQLEARGMQLDDLGRQVLTYGKVHTAEELCAQIDDVKSADIQRVASNMLKTPLSMSATGNLSHVPKYDLISKRFG